MIRIIDRPPPSADYVIAKVPVALLAILAPGQTGDELDTADVERALALSAEDASRLRNAATAIDNLSQRRPGR